MNAEERQLSDLLHRLTPEPPRRVAIEDIAFRMANQAGRGRGGGHREAHPRRFGGRSLVPALAAVSIIAVAGLSAGVAVLVSNHGSPSAGGGPLTTSTPASASSSAPATPLPVSSGTATQPSAIDGGPWGAELIDHATFTQDSLVAGDGALFAISPGFLDRINPATGAVADVPVVSPVPGPPVISGHTVWVASYQPGGAVDLQGYDASTLAHVASWQATAIGAFSTTPQGVLAAGPDGTLYVAAGLNVVAVDPSNGSVIHRYILSSGLASSVAVSPDGRTLYVGAGSFQLTTIDVAGYQVTGKSSLDLGGAGGNLVATPGGVWGTLGVGNSEWAWYAPRGNLAHEVRVGQGAGGGLASVPAYSDGHIWIGGGQMLLCADPSSGQVLASANLPTDHGAQEFFSSVAVAGSQAYAYYQDEAAQRSGIVQMTLPAACAA